MQRSVVDVVLVWLMNNKLIYIAGPTCIGKTSLSIEIAKRLETEIISCDSRQFYKELKIGTSPPSREQLKEINHHFIHNKSLLDEYSVGDYEEDAISTISNIFKNNANAVVYIGNEKDRSMGTGSIIDKNGTIITNWHVVADASKVQIWLKPDDLEKMDERVLIYQPSYTGTVIKKNKRKEKLKMEIL